MEINARLRKFSCLIYLSYATLLISAGFWFWIPNSTRADAGKTFSFALGSRSESDSSGHPPLPDTVPLLSRRGLVQALNEAMHYDQRVILGIALVLIGCLSVFAALVSFSKPHSKLRNYFIAAVLISLVAHALVVGLIHWSLDPPHLWPVSRISQRFWIDLTTAMTAFEFGSLMVAFMGAVASLVLLIRWVFSHGQACLYRRHNDRDWWDKTLPGDEAPGPVEDAPPHQSAWRGAFFVPDAFEVVRKYKKGGLGPTALCLSGGGIRSACVSMGAMQAFADLGRPRDSDSMSTPKLDDFDWVVSVSGGGFSAGARLLGVQPRRGRDEASSEHSGAGLLRLSDRFTPGSVEFDYLRRRSSYIASSPLGFFRAFSEVFKNFLVSALAVYWSAVILGLILGFFVVKGPGVTAFARDVARVHSHPVIAFAAAGIPITFAIAFVSLSQFLRWLSGSSRVIRIHRYLMRIGKGLAFFALPVLVLTVVTPALIWVCEWLPTAPGVREICNWLPYRGLVGALLAIPAVIASQYGITVLMLAAEKSFLNPIRWLESRSPGAVRILLFFFPFGVLISGWLLVFGIVAGQVVSYFDRVDNTANANQNQTLVLEAGRLLKNAVLSPSPMVLALVAITLALSVLDVTSLSLHQFYRRRLARAFAVRRIGDDVQQYDPNEMMWLDQYGRTPGEGPKFVFAAAAAISEGDIAPPQGLNAVSFVMTSNYLGGPNLGWLKTEELRGATAPRLRRDLTVDTAVAVSGSAFASAMGRHGSGIQTLLAALSGARLGTWLPNPRFVLHAKRNAANPWFPKALPSVRGLTYLYREVLSMREAEAPLVQVTDGGHYENLGLVEALRRRCRLIYSIDSGLDEGNLLTGLADAVRLAKFELGVEIILEETGPYGVQNLVPGSGLQFEDGHAFAPLNSRITNGAVVRAKILYPEASDLGEDQRSGVLIFAKAVLWRQLPHWVLTHSGQADGLHFPHDTTSDQWFTERRFAAYTELGRRIATAAISVPISGDVSDFALVSSTR